MYLFVLEIVLYSTGGVEISGCKGPDNRNRKLKFKDNKLKIIDDFPVNEGARNFLPTSLGRCTVLM